MADEVLSLGLGPLPKPPPPPLADRFSVRSVVLRAGPEEPSPWPRTLGWLSRGVMGIRTPAIQYDLHAAQQADRLKAEDPANGRASRDDVDAYRRGGRVGLYGDYVEPPFDLKRLAEMLFHSPDYQAIVEQNALDVASDWLLVDANQVNASQRVEMILDLAAKTEATLAKAWLEGLFRGFDDEPITLIDWVHRVIEDRSSMGNAYSEIVRKPITGKIDRVLHIPGYLIRRHASGGRYVEVNEAGSPVAYFRRFGREPTDRDYISREEVGYSAQEISSLKPELADFHRYHPAERWYGIPPIVSAFNQVAGNIFASNRNVRFFVNRGMPDYAVLLRADQASLNHSESKLLLDNAQKKVEEHMKYLLEGEDHRTLVLTLPTGEVDIEFRRINDLPQDGEWAEYQKDNRDTILRVYRMQPSQIGIIETASLGTGTGENQAERYKRSTIEPQQREVETFVNALLDEAGFRKIRFRFVELDIIDESAEIAMLVQTDATGILSINEERNWLSRIIKDQDFPPDEHEYADIPKRLLELQLAGALQPGGPMGGPEMGSQQSPGLLQSLLGQRPRPTEAADMAALRGRQPPPGAPTMTRLEAARARLGIGNGNGTAT